MIVVNDNSHISQYINQATSVEIIENNKKTVFKKGNEKFNALINKILIAFEGARIMPALGVSFSADVLEDLKTGQFVKINFDKQLKINDLPFTALLFKLEEVYGLNLIRENDNKFDGRCIYLSLNNLTNLKEILKN